MKKLGNYIKCEEYILNNPKIKLEFIQNIDKSSGSNTKYNFPGFVGYIDNAGCTSGIVSQENHILEAFGGSISPKNIVIQTDGSGNIYGSFFRDDTLTSPKGDVRGSGANDLSVFREECSQVASGDFSTILGGRNNTASGELSIVAGLNNTASGEYSSVLGGSSNVDSSQNGILLGGFRNSILASNASIFNGISNVNNGVNSTIISGTNNIVTSGQNNIILNGQSNSTGATNTFIGAGSSNVNQSRNSGIISGSNNNIGGTGTNHFIATGKNNLIQNISIASGILTGESNIINNSFNSLVVGGQNNTLTTSSGNSSNMWIGGGIRNSVQNNNTCIVCGVSNNSVSTNSFIGTGFSNNINLQTQTPSNNAILTGNVCSMSSTVGILGVIICGTSNSIIASSPRCNNFIGSGRNNSVSNVSFNGVIFTGISNGNFGANSFICSGFSNSICNATHSGILTGSRNSLGNSPSVSNYVIVCGETHSVARSGGFSSFIGAGTRTLNTSSGNAFSCGVVTGLTGINISGSNLFFGTGSNNTHLLGSANQSVFITGNNHNSAGNALNSIHITGNNNFLNINAIGNLLGTGDFNRIETSCLRSSIISATNSTITGTVTNSCIGSGVSNFIYQASANPLVIGSNSIVCGFGLTAGYPSTASFGQFNDDRPIGGFNRVFTIGIGTTGGTGRRNAFSVNSNGVVYGLEFANSGADFAEYFENYSKNKLPIGESVCMIDENFIGKIINNQFKFENSTHGFTENDLGKILLSSETPDEIEPFGVVVSSSGYIGNAFEDEWKGKYERDEFGNIIYDEEIEEVYVDEFDISLNTREDVRIERKVGEDNQVIYQYVKRLIPEEFKIPIYQDYPLYNEMNDKMGTISDIKKKRIYQTKKAPRISLQFNPNLAYIPRSQRLEWNLIGLKGQVIIKSGQRTSLEWTKMNTISNDTYQIKI
jgi:hypothetical protein